MQGGVIALIFAWLIGPRFGKYDKNGNVAHPIVPHSIPLVMLGTGSVDFWIRSPVNDADLEVNLT